jgi:hypothetical protein
MTSDEHKSKSTLILMIAVFVLPVILAFFALKFDWFNKAATNRGDLLQPVIEAQSLLSDSDINWHLLYVIPQECLIECENALYGIEQTYRATGKESDRVSLLFIATENSSSEALEKARSKTGAILLQKSQNNVNEVFKNVDINAIFISDTQHNIVLRYPVTQDKQQAIMDSRDILADLKKLLKLSRIG